MNVVLVSNFMNHHQVALCDELYKLTKGSFVFVETEEMPHSFKIGGYPSFSRTYVVKAWLDERERQKALTLSRSADVVIGSNGKGNIPFIKDRLKNGMLTFDCSERPLKKGWINMFSPANVISQFYYHLFFYNKP